MTPTVPAEFPEALLARLRRQTPRIWLSFVLIAANIGVFLAMLASGAGLWHSPNEIQLAWGANFAPATRDGEYWRLGSALFLHFGLIHLSLNMWALWDGGQYVERFFGPLRFIAIYLLSGLAGNLLSLVMQGNQAVSGGASGAIFGIYGALVAALWFSRQDIHTREFRWLFWGAIGFTGATLGLGLMIRGVDNYAHAGGMATGVLLGAMLVRPLGGASAILSGRVRIAATLMLCGAIVLLVNHIPEPRYRWSDETQARQSIRQFIDTEAEIGQHWQSLLAQGKRDELTFEQVADRIDSDIAERYEESFEQLSRVQVTPGLPSGPAVRNLQAYAELRRNALRTLADGLRAHDTEQIKRGLEMTRQAQQLASPSSGAGTAGQPNK